MYCTNPPLLYLLARAWDVCFQPKVHVNYDFQPRSEDELEIRRGEVVTVTDNSDQDWFEGQVERDNVIYKGHFPVNYVTQIWAHLTS